MGMDAHRKRIPFEYSLKTQRLHEMLSTLQGGRNDIELYIPRDIVDVQCVLLGWDIGLARTPAASWWTVALSQENEILQDTLKNFQIAGESHVISSRLVPNNKETIV